MPPSNHPTSDTAIEELRARWRRARRRLLFLDYDGTLRELAPTPEQASPPASLLALLRALAAVPATAVHVVSGRARDTLGAWLGGLPVHLCAEHGLAHRPPGGTWQLRADVALDWLPAVRALLADATAEVPGSLLETKPAGLAWHYRLADAQAGPRRAARLLAELAQLLADAPASPLSGHGVVEVRPRGIDKGSYVAACLHDLGAQDLVLCAGDDRTDLDMYQRLPPGALALHVGQPIAPGTWTLPDPAALRQLLQVLAATAPDAGAAPGT